VELDRVSGDPVRSHIHSGRVRLYTTLAAAFADDGLGDYTWNLTGSPRIS